MRALLLCLALLLAAAPPLAAEERPRGLMWNRSGLPATLPLQVLTPPGEDYLLHLVDPATGTPVLAAYIRGGAPFRVLVPPGAYRLAFAAGRDWQGEAARFGPATRSFTLDAPLRFAAGLRRKEGHLVDLRDPQAIAIRDFAFCQRLGLDPGTPPPGPADPLLAPPAPVPPVPLPPLPHVFLPDRPTARPPETDPAARRPAAPHVPLADPAPPPAAAPAPPAVEPLRPFPQRSHDLVTYLCDP